MEFDAIIQAVHIAIPVGVFVACFIGVKSPFRPSAGTWLALALIGGGAAFQIIFISLGSAEWRGLGPFLLMQRGTIWHGTTLVAVGYGLLAFSAVRAMRTPRRGDG